MAAILYLKKKELQQQVTCLTSESAVADATWYTVQ